MLPASYLRALGRRWLARPSRTLFRALLGLAGLLLGVCLWYRTTNLWTLKNLGDGFLRRQALRREILLGAFHRAPQEQNGPGSFAVVQFLGDSRLAHDLFCESEADGRKLRSRALVQRIHQGKRGVNDVCSWAGHLAECELASGAVTELRLSAVADAREDEKLRVALEPPLHRSPKHKLVVCVAPLYVYTEWKILATGIETWLALGASQLVFPVQSASNFTLALLQKYVDDGLVLLRHWPKWPTLSDANPNGLVLSRGIEESHVNCLHFAKPFAEMVAFTDIDDILIPPDPSRLRPTSNVELLEALFREHPQASSLLFEHRDVQFVLPTDEREDSLAGFDFGFLRQTRWKQNCFVWRMKTRVVVMASRVDTVNMHETGVSRLGFVQVRVPCRKAHFYHLRHSYKDIAVNQWPVDMGGLAERLQRAWEGRLASNLAPLANVSAPRASLASFDDFDKCVMAVTEEHFRLQVSRCMTPHACFLRADSPTDCLAADADYSFVRSGEHFLVGQGTGRFVPSTRNCDAPTPEFTSGSHFYMP